MSKKMEGVEDFKGVVDGGGLRESQKTEKLALHLIPPELLEQTAQVLGYGARKYAPGNWKRGMSFMASNYASIQRHLLAWAQGEDRDPESGLPHMAHVACTVGFIMYYQNRPELYDKFDDRDKLLAAILGGAEPPPVDPPVSVAAGDDYEGDHKCECTHLQDGLTGQTCIFCGGIIE